MLFFQSYIMKTLRAALRQMGKLLLLRMKEVERTLRLSSAKISGDHLNKDDGNEFKWVRFI
ncbi:hypothetical protein COJ96_03575 [Bacillus sp. AFS073361]|nr:hypothetical protein COJ96_03575 [Bacillus sp. AFS073361]